MFVLYELCCFFFFFKQKTAYEMRISDWSSDVCSSDLEQGACRQSAADRDRCNRARLKQVDALDIRRGGPKHLQRRDPVALQGEIGGNAVADADPGDDQRGQPDQREELAHSLEEPVGARRGAVAVLELPARRGVAPLQTLT